MYYIELLLLIVCFLIFSKLMVKKIVVYFFYIVISCENYIHEWKILKTKKKTITFEENNDGFLYFMIDNKKITTNLLKTNIISLKGLKIGYNYYEIIDNLTKKNYEEEKPLVLQDDM